MGYVRTWYHVLWMVTVIAAPTCIVASTSWASTGEIIEALTESSAERPRTSAYLHRSGGADATRGRCESCHRQELDFGHPVYFVPARSLPAATPLDDRGRFTCNSCHVVRTVGSGSPPGDNCRRCHELSFFASMADRGGSLSALAHPISSLGQTVPEDGAALDRVSAQCLECHDSHARLPGELRGRHGRSDHPVGSRYSDHLSYGGYTPPSRLPRRIRLPGGRIGCVSCHQSYSAQHGALVRLDRGSSLCSACHQL